MVRSFPASATLTHKNQTAFYCNVCMLFSILNLRRHSKYREGLIAVNYPARARGITRHMRVQDALKQCPELRLVHVETIGDGPRQEEQDIHDTANTTTADSLIAQQEKALSRHQPSNEAPPPAAATSVPSVQQRNDEATQQHYLRQTQKACLERYRRANGDIMSLLHRLAPSAVIEKASIDEVYVDATAMVDAEMRLSDADVAMTDPRACEGGLGSREGQRETGNAGRGRAGVEDAFAWGSIVLGDMPLDPGSEFDRRLATGAGIACRLRAAIRQELG
jgi:nucleotidyltransferase/DNA polymerase involved in DNA repair